MGPEELDGTAVCPSSPFKFTFKTLIIKQNTHLQSIPVLQDPVIKVTFIGHFLSGRHSPEVFTYIDLLIYL